MAGTKHRRAGAVIALGGLLVFPMFGFFEDTAATVRVVCAYFLVADLFNIRWSMRPGPAWPDRSRYAVLDIARQPVSRA